MTPTGELLVRELRGEAAHFDDITTTDCDALTKSRAEAKRDVYDSLVQRLPRLLAQVEAEAVEEYRGVAAWLDRALESV